jgi:hypothetical protein
VKLLPFLPAEQLLEHLKIDPHLRDVEQLASFDSGLFDELIKKPVYQFVEWCQLAPASQSHHHSGPGGLIQHTLDMVKISLKKRRGMQLPIGGSLEAINSERHQWTYAIVMGCLLHDIGKLSSSIRLILVRSDGTEIPFVPLGHSIKKIMLDKSIRGYRIEFPESDYRLHEKLSLLHFNLLPTSGQRWLISSSNIIKQLMNFLWGDRFESGVIGDIIEFADRESTSRNLQIPSPERFSNQIPAIDRYLKLLRHWVTTGGIRINTNGGMAWSDTDGYIYFVCRPLAEKLIHELNNQGLRNLPQDPVRVYDILQEHGYAISTEDGKAIWSISVKTGEYQHKLTCLKFEARKLTTPTKPLSAFEGEIVILTGDEAGSDITTPATVIPFKPAKIEDEESILLNQDEQLNYGKQEVESETDPANKQETMTETVAEESAKESGNETGIDDQETDTSSGGILEKIRHETVKEKKETATPLNTNKPSEDGIPLTPLFDFESPDTAHRFINWLRRGLIEKTLLLNNPSAEIHIAEEGVFLLAPAIFKTFLRRHGLPEDKHKNLARRVNTLKLHTRNGDVNIHGYWVSSKNRKTKINGYLFPFNVFFEHDMPIPSKNKYLVANLEGE